MHTQHRVRRIVKLCGLATARRSRYEANVVRRCLLLVLLLAAGACHPPTTPLGVAERFLRATHGKGQGARRWLAPGAAALSPTALTESLRAAGIGAAFAVGPERRLARRTLGADEPLGLERIGERFYLSRDPLDAYPRTTAELCLRSFVRAIDSHRTERIAEFLPRRFRNTLDTEALGRATEGPLRELADLIRRNLQRPLDYLGPDEARLSLDERRGVRLRRSEEGWVVESFDG